LGGADEAHPFLTLSVAAELPLPTHLAVDDLVERAMSAELTEHLGYEPHQEEVDELLAAGATRA